MSVQVQQQPIVVSTLVDSLAAVVDVDTSKPIVSNSFDEDDCGAEDHTHRTDEMSDASTEEEDHKHAEEDDDHHQCHDDLDCWNPPSIVDEQLSTLQQIPSSFTEEEEKATEGSPTVVQRTTPPEQQQQQHSIVVVKTSILKRSLTDPLHLKDSRRVWKCLPQPDISSLNLQSKCEPITTTTSQRSRRSTSKGGRVKFDSITVRSYSQTLGDNPSVSYGPPIQLDWDYEEHESIQLDDYEDSRPQRRTLRQMVLSYYQRKNVLTWQYGYTEEALKKAKKDAERAQMKRSITKALMPAMLVETALESAKRKAKRLVGAGGGSK